MDRKTLLFTYFVQLFIHLNLILSNQYVFDRDWRSQWFQLSGAMRLTFCLNYQTIKTFVHFVCYIQTRNANQPQVQSVLSNSQKVPKCNLPPTLPVVLG